MSDQNKVKHRFKKGHFYHIYNHTVSGELMFRDQENYHFFMERWVNYLDDLVDVYAYCLMPDHFHFLIRVKKEVTGDIHKRVTQAFRNFFSSYTLSFNKYWERSGSLFARSYKRKRVSQLRYLRALIRYIHENPIEHKFVDDCRLWKYSSHPAMLSQKDTRIKRREVLKLCGGKKEYINLHATRPDYSQINHLLCA